MAKASFSDGAIRMLTFHQRNVLLAHIDGPVDIVATTFGKVQIRNGLMDGGLLRGDPANTVRPRKTALTEAGRRAVGMILGDYADALVRAGLLEQQNPLAVLNRLRATGAFPPKTTDSPRTLADVLPETLKIP